MRTRRRGLTILEVVIAIAVLAAVIVPIADSFSTLRTGFVTIGRHTIALGLARAVLDHIHYRIYDGDGRVGTTLMSDTEKVAAATAGDGQAFFDALAEADRIVTAQDPDRTSTYFLRINDLTKSGVVGITEANDPDLFRQLKDYVCAVDVYFSVPGDVLDSDVNGTPEVDMAEVRVTIGWNEHGQDRSLELWSVFTRREYNEVQ